MPDESGENPLLPCIERQDEDQVAIRGRGPEIARMTPEDLYWLCAVAGPAVLAGAERVERGPCLPSTSSESSSSSS